MDTAATTATTMSVRRLTARVAKVTINANVRTHFLRDPNYVLDIAQIDLLVNDLLRDNQKGNVARNVVVAYVKDLFDGNLTPGDISEIIEKICKGDDIDSGMTQDEQAVVLFALKRAIDSRDALIRKNLGNALSRKLRECAPRA
jgi:hypothetical protein